MPQNAEAARHSHSSGALQIQTHYNLVDVTSKLTQLISFPETADTTIEQCEEEDCIQEWFRTFLVFPQLKGRHVYTSTCTALRTQTLTMASTLPWMSVLALESVLSKYCLL